MSRPALTEATLSDRYWPFRGPRSFLFVSSSQPASAAKAVQGWIDGPPDLCVVSPSSAARRTAVVACGGRFVQVLEEPLLARRGRNESDSDFAARRADALRLLHELDTCAALVVSDDLFAPVDTPFFADSETLLERADEIERTLPLP